MIITTTSVLKKPMRKSIIKISLSHSRRRPALRPLITDVLLPRISTPEAAAMPTISCFLHRAVVIPRSRGGNRETARGESPGLGLANASLEFSRGPCARHFGRLFSKMVRLENDGPGIKTPVVMSSFRRLRAYVLLKKREGERKRKRETISARISLEVSRIGVETQNGVLTGGENGERNAEYEGGWRLSGSTYSSLSSLVTTIVTPPYCAPQRSGIAAAPAVVTSCRGAHHVSTGRSIISRRRRKSGLLFIFNRGGASVGERAPLLWLTRSRFADQRNCAR